MSTVQLHKTLEGINISLRRIAQSQEDLVALAKQDIEAEIEAQLQGRAEQVATEMNQETTRRSFIGKK